MRVYDNTTAKRFEIELDEESAVLAYRLGADSIAFTHIEVPASQRGQGIGEELTRAALESARHRNLRVIPECPFVARYIKDHPEYRDLLLDRTPH